MLGLERLSVRTKNILAFHAILNDLGECSGFEMSKIGR
jgi:hypothetical protein